MKRDLNMNDKIDRRSCGGFSLLELVIVVVVLLVLSSLVAVNWSSFMRYQELRSEAFGLHRELIAQKAKALELGDVGAANFIMITFPSTGGYSVRTPVIDDATGDVANTSKSVSMNGMTVDVPESMGTAPSGMLPSANRWVSAEAGEIEITIEPDNMNAFEEGWVVVSSPSSKRQFSIVVNKARSINPELYVRNGNGSWKKM